MKTLHLKQMLATGLVALLSLSACTPKEVKPVVNKAPADLNPTDAPTASEPAKFTTMGPQAYKALDLGHHTMDLSKGPSVQAVIDKVILPLGRVVLSPNVYTSALVHENKYKQALRLFHQAILYINVKDPAALTKTGVLKLYKQIVFEDCNQELRGTCANLNTFAGEGRFPFVLMAMVDNGRESDVLEYYSVLRAATERYSATLNQELSYLYLKRANDLSRHYIKIKGETKSDRYDAAAIDSLRIHARLTQNALANFDPKKIPRAEFEKLMKDFNPWDLSRRSSDLLGVQIDRVLNLASNGFLYDTKSSGGLSSNFTASASKIFDGEDDIYGLGINQIKKSIAAGDSRDLLNNLGIGQNIDTNEYLYLVDRVYYAHFTTSDAVAFWKLTKQDRVKLFTAVNIFVKLQIAHMIVWTNNRMSNFFKESMDKKGKSVIGGILSLMQQAVSNSLTNQAKWDQTLTRVRSVMKFVDSAFGSIDIFTLKKDDPYRELTEKITSLPQNIKMLSVYPNMMMLVYIMAIENFNDKIQGYWGSYVITAESLIESFFISVMAPWFNFGTDSIKLSQVELLYALNFTLQTETFSAYRSNPIVPVTASSFFKEVSNKLLNPQAQKMVDQLNAMRSALSATQDSLNEVMAVCEIERKLQLQDQKTGTLQPRPYTRNIPYDMLSVYLANGFGIKDKSTPFNSISSLYELSGGTTDTVSTQLNRMRVETGARLLQLENMKSVLVSYLEDTKADTTAVLLEYEKEVSKLTSVRDQYILNVYRILNRIGDCDSVLYKHEMDLRNALYQREEAYLDWVHKNVVGLNDKFAQNPDAAQADADSLNKILRDRVQADLDLPEVYRQKGGYDRFTRTSAGYQYDYYVFDAILRARRSLEEMSDGATKVVLPNFAELKVNEYQSPVAHPIQPWNVSTREAFVRDGMRQFIVSLKIENNLAPQFMINKLNILTELYRLGPIHPQTGALRCVDDANTKCLQISPRKIVDQTFQILDVAHVTDLDVKVLQWASKTQKFDDLFWEKLAMESKTRRHLPVLDLTFQRVASDGPADTGNFTSKFLELTRDYFDADAAVGEYLFQPPEKVKALIKANYARHVNDYQEKGEAFLAAYKAIQLADPYRLSHLRRTLDNVLTVSTEVVDGQTVPQYLGRDRINRFRSTVNSFHQRTEGQFERK